MADSPLVSGYGLNYGLNYGLPGPSSGTSAVVLSSITASTAAAVIIRGAADRFLNPLGSNEHGAVLVDGKSTSTLAALGSSAAGDVPVGGHSQRTFAAIDSTATGSVSISAQSVYTLTGLAAAATGIVKPQPSFATSHETFGGITDTAVGQTVIAASSSRYLALMGSSELGAVVIDGTSDESINDILGSAAGAIPVEGGSAVALDAVGALGFGGVTVQAGASQTLQAVLGITLGSVPAGGTSARVLGGLDGGAAARVLIGADSARILAPMGSSEAGEVLVSGTSVQHLAVLLGSAFASVPASGSTSIVLDDVIGSATGGPVIAGSSHHTLAGVTATAAGGVNASGVSAITLKDVTGLFRGIIASVEISVDLPGDVRVLNIAPNWGARYTKSFEFKTDIITSRSGKEQRRALRQTAREELSFTADLDGLQAQAFDAELMGWMTRRFLVPEHPRRVFAVSEQPPFGSMISIDEMPSWLVPGIRVILQHGDQIERRVVIATYGPDVYFADTTFRSWPVGTTITAARTGRVPSGGSIRRTTSNVGQYAFSFLVEPASDAAQVIPEAGNFYRDTEVFAVAPNWAEPFSGTFVYDVDELDFGRGRIDYYDPVKFRQRQIRSTYLGRDHAEIDAILGAFMRASGRRGSLYMPTWQRDLELGMPIDPGASSLIVMGEATKSYLDGDAAHRDIAIVRNDRSLVCRRITSVNPYGDHSELVFDEPLPADLAASDVESISWLYRWRFASDKVEIEYVTDSVAQCQLTFLSLESDQ